MWSTVEVRFDERQAREWNEHESAVALWDSNLLHFLVLIYASVPSLLTFRGLLSILLALDYIELSLKKRGCCKHSAKHLNL